ncbi:hypothetical protein B0J11DRAFT_42722 [Dendryphion nanum]|uniref:Uncharacterized protein n=1 Tax=Dendryphion nanum TaxID=256645 RepID=A0A9P9J2Z4_9PLEO|nr:hypothetical protein B0J11DRAFT_42722 [Dendryphion nanum]
MSYSQGGQGPAQGHGKPPYAPRIASLGGLPDVMPDIPITATYLFLYIVFAIIHFKILKTNQKRGHKFAFSGALFGFCKVRIFTMSLRIAWACYDRNINLGIAATIFVYVGTIILYIVNWFFTQRVVRAQHGRWGWSKPYRIFHRAALGCLIACLLMLIVAAIQQFFTVESTVLRIDRTLQLTGQTYFSAFTFAPIILVFLSLTFPRRKTEKFGAGRFRNNIVILLIGATVLSIGQIFRCVTMWLPPVALRGPRGPQEPPWYFSRTCFYLFNFTTEILVVMFYAIVRVDLRFHILDGSKGPGDYAKGRRESQYRVGIMGDEKKLKRASAQGLDGIHQSNSSNDTLHEYEASLFDDTRTLADSLRYPSSVLEVDSKTGNWKIKRISSLHSDRWSDGSEPSLWSPDRDTYIEHDAPPVPQLPNNWPLRESQMPRDSVAVLEHQNRSSRGHSAHGSIEIPGHEMNRVDMSNAIADAISKLEANSESRKRSRKDGPPDYDAINATSIRSGVETPYKKAFFPGSDRPRKHLYSPSSPRAPASDLPKKHDYSSTAQKSEAAKPLNSNRSSSSPLSSNQLQFLPLTEAPMQATRHMSLTSTATHPSIDTNEEAIQEFARFSDETPQQRSEDESSKGQKDPRNTDRGKGKQ